MQSEMSTNSARKILLEKLGIQVNLDGIKIFFIQVSGNPKPGSRKFWEPRLNIDELITKQRNLLHK